MSRPGPLLRKAIIGIVLLAALAALLTHQRRADDITVTALFPSAVGVYEGSEVRLMGVPIGTVTEVTAEAGQVRLELRYDGEHKMPDDVRAVIVSPSIIADRFVQLTPSYDGSGPVLATGAVIPLDRTRTPLELDEVLDQTDEVLSALGPRGAGAEGALSDALGVAAENLRGNGELIQRALTGLGNASTTLSGSGDKFFDTVENLQAFTRQLAGDDAEVKRFNQQLSDLGVLLSGEREELATVLTTLARTFTIVETFVRTHRKALVKNVDQLTGIVTTLDDQRTALETLLRVSPTGLNNLLRVWDSNNQGVRARGNFDRFLANPQGLVCDSLIRAGLATADSCALLGQILGGQGLGRQGAGSQDAGDRQ